MVFLLKDFIGKNPSAYSGYIFKSINHLIQNELMLELALLESKRAGLLQAQEKLFDKALSDESDSLAAVLDDNINQPQLHTRIREQLDEITTLLENTAVGAELKLNSKALADIESEREQILFRFVEKPEVLQAYEQGVSSNSYYFSTQEVGLMAELFEKRVVIFSQANGVVEKVLEEGDLNHPLVEVFHKGAHFSRLERK